MRAKTKAKSKTKALAGLSLALGAGACQALCLAPLCTCTVAVTSVVFPTYNPISLNGADSAGNVRVTCGGVAGLLIPYNVALGPGAGAFTARQMSKGAKKLQYNLYTSSAYATVWGDATGATGVVGGSFTLSVLGTAPPADHPVYGRIPPAQFTVEPGSYTDTLTLTLTYF